MRRGSRVLVVAEYYGKGDPLEVGGKVVPTALVRINGSKTISVIPESYIERQHRFHHYLTDTDFERRRADVGLRIRRLRQQANLSQEQLAAAIGVRQATVSRWEKGAITPRLSVVVAIASVLNVGSDEILKGVA